MPIDARIPLNSVAPQVQMANPGRLLTQGYTLRNLQARDERQRLLLDEEQKAVQRATATREAVAANAGNPRAMIQAVESGGDVATASDIRQHQWEQRKAATEQRIKELDLGMQQLEAQSQIMGPVKDETSYRQALGTMYAQGFIGLEQLTEADQQGWTPETQAEIEQQRLQGMAYKDQLAEERAQTEAGYKKLAEARAATAAAETTAAHQATLPGKVADAEVKQITAGQMAKHGMTAAQKAAVERPRPGVDVPYSPAVEDQRGRIAAKRGGATGGLSIASPPLPADWKPGDLNPAVLEGQPTRVVNLTKQLVGYKIPYPGSRMANSEPFQSAIELAGLYDPTWTASEYKTRLSARRSFTSGKDSQNITQINTVVRHLQSLKEAAEALDNTWSPSYNTFENFLIKQKGDPRLTAFNMAKNAAYSELAAVFKGTGAAATDQEMKEWKSNIDDSNSPAQLAEVVITGTELVAGRLAALKDKWEKSMGKPAGFKVLSDGSRKTLLEMGLDPNKVERGGQPAVEAGEGGPSESGAVLQVGTIEGGYRYKGGNPASPDSWEAVQ